MKLFKMPAVLHEVFGEKQSIGTIAVILLFGCVLTAAAAIGYPELYGELPVWRNALALLLVFDIFCGCIANFTASTSRYYAQRKSKRIVFIAVHVHLPFVALLLDEDIRYAAAVWGYTIAGALIVNAGFGKQTHRFAAGLLLAAGIGWMSLVPDIPPYMRAVACFLCLRSYTPLPSIITATPNLDIMLSGFLMYNRHITRKAAAPAFSLRRNVR